MGNRFGAKPEGGKEHKRRSAAGASGTPFEEMVDSTAESTGDPPHIVDFTA